MVNTPTNLSVTDASTEDELTLDWDVVTNASGYFVYRAQSSGSVKSDYTQIADVSGPPYTDTGLEDGEKFYYRVSAHD
jgi:fibronectin type 3 domain-containing protein